MQACRRCARPSLKRWPVLGRWRAAMAEGALSAKHKEPMALAIGITQHCSGCIGFHVKALHKLHCTRAELEEMLAVCVYRGGGPALIKTRACLNRLQASGATASTWPACWSAW